MSGQYIYVEDAQSPTPSKLKKKRLSPLSEQFRREGLAQELPFDRRPSDHRYPDKKVETIPIPLKGVHFDPAVAHQDKEVLDAGQHSITTWLSELTLAGFRLHDSASAARTSQNRQRHSDVFSALEQAFADQGHTKIDMAGVATFLTATPRGANAAFTEDTVAKVVSQRLGMKADDPLVRTVEHDLLEAADGWSPKSTDNPATAEIRAEALLKALDWPVTVNSLLATTEPETDPALEGYALNYATISYDAQSAPDSDSFLSTAQAPEGQFEIALSCAATRCESGEPPSQLMISKGPTFNGLSWLLNPKRGLAMWAEADPDAIAEHFGAPVLVVSHLQREAREIVKRYHGAFGQLHELRNQIGGTVSSFAERYLSRVNELLEVCEQLTHLFESVALPEALAAERAERAFWGTGFNADTLFHNWQALASGTDAMKEAAQRLAGHKPGVSIKDLERLENDLDSARALFGQLRQVLNNLRGWQQDIEAAQAQGNHRVAAEGSGALSLISIPQDLITALDFKGAEAVPVNDSEPACINTKIEIPFIARRRSRSYGIQHELEATRANLNQAVARALELTDTLQQGRPLGEQALSVFRTQDERHMANRGIAVSDNALEIGARRHLLQEWFGFWRSLSRPAVDFAQQQLVDLDLGYSDDPDNQDQPGFRWRHKAHLFMQEQKGLLWKSLFARGKHKPYGLNSQHLLGIDMSQLLDTMTRWLESQHEALAYEAVEVDYHALIAKRLEMAARTSSAALYTGDLGIDSWPLAVTFRPAERQMLDTGDVLDVKTLSRAASRLAVSIRDAASFLNRQQHLDSATFKLAKDLESLAYISKQSNPDGEARYWCPPQRLWVSTGEAGQMLRALMDEREPVAVGTLFHQIKQRLITKAPEGEQRGCRQLLAEMPHSWGVLLTGTGVSSDCDYSLEDVVMVNDQAITRPPRKGKLCLMEIKPTWSNMLDETLVQKRELMAGNITLRYRYTRASGYEIEPVRAEAHVPSSKVVGPVANIDQSPYFDRLMGVDLGERGIGFSVRRVDQANTPVVERGFVPVPAIRKLIKATRDYRKRHQKKMSVRTSHVQFDEMREAVAGNVVSVIKYLMSHYKALPVLEMDLHNLNGGDKQLSHVYSAVTDYFLSRGVPTADDARKNTWRGFRIMHRHMERVVTDPKTRETTIKPFYLYPGSGVRAANTSRSCSGCGVNPVKLIKDADASQFALDGQGQTEINGVKLRFYTPGSINRMVAGKGELEPMANKVMAQDRLVSHLLSSQLRIKPESHQSQDTSQSRYWCPNVDCKHHDQLIHADLNAADNIVMRRIESLVRKDIERAA